MDIERFKQHHWIYRIVSDFSKAQIAEETALHDQADYLWQLREAELWKLFAPTWESFCESILRCPVHKANRLADLSGLCGHGKEDSISQFLLDSCDYSVERGGL